MYSFNFLFWFFFFVFLFFFLYQLFYCASDYFIIDDLCYKLSHNVTKY